MTRRRRSCVRTVGLHPLTQKGRPNATQSPSVCVDRQRQNAWQLARSIARLATVCRVSSRPSPRPTPGAVSDELTSSACGLIGFDDPGPQAVTGTYLRRAALDRLSAASSAQSTWATRRKTRRAVRPWGKRALVRIGCFRSAEQGAALRGIRGKSHRIGAHPAPCRSSPGPLF